MIKELNLIQGTTRHFEVIVGMFPAWERVTPVQWPGSTLPECPRNMVRQVPALPVHLGMKMQSTWFSKFSKKIIWWEFSAKWKRYSHLIEFSTIIEPWESILYTRSQQIIWFIIDVNINGAESLLVVTKFWGYWSKALMIILTTQCFVTGKCKSVWIFQRDWLKKYYWKYLYQCGWPNTTMGLYIEVFRVLLTCLWISPKRNINIVFSQSWSDIA